MSRKKRSNPINPELLEKWEDFGSPKEEIELEEQPVAKPKKRYIAIKGVNLDEFKARYEPGDEIPAEFLEDPSVDLDNLLSKGAVKEE